MNNQDARGELDWATLECEKPKPVEEDQAERTKKHEQDRALAAESIASDCPVRRRIGLAAGLSQRG